MKIVRLICAFVILAVSGSAFAQEGFPLSGTWSGDWGPNAKERNQVTLIMSWDGKAISGQIGVGPDAAPLKNATLDSTKWTVRFEYDGKDPKGAPAHFVVEGKLDKLGSYNRVITGTWTVGNSKNEFKLERAS